MDTKARRALYQRHTKRSLCRKKSIANPNKCKKLKNCKVARGSKRQFCRKKRSTRYSKRV